MFRSTSIFEQPAQFLEEPYAHLVPPEPRPVLLPNMSEDDLRKVMEEGLEVAFIICNFEFAEYTMAKVFDLFDQIFPTAIVMNTAYWPFYHSLKGQPICVCERFGVLCSHFKNKRHWLDLSAIPGDRSNRFYPAYTGPLYPTSIDIEMTPVYGPDRRFQGYEFSINMIVRSLTETRGRFRGAMPFLLPTTIVCRYELQTELYSPLYGVIFQTNVFDNPNYRTMFLQTPNIQAPLFSQMFPNHSDAYAVLCQRMPQQTMFLREATLPLSEAQRRVEALKVYPIITVVAYVNQTNVGGWEEAESLEERFRSFSATWTDEDPDGMGYREMAALEGDPTIPTGRIYTRGASQQNCELVKREAEDYDDKWPSLPRSSKVVKVKSPRKPRARNPKGAAAVSVDQNNNAPSGEGTSRPRAVPRKSVSFTADKNEIRKIFSPENNEVIHISSPLLSLDDEFEIIEGIIKEDLENDESRN